MTDDQSRLKAELLRGGEAGRELRQVGASPADRRTYLALAAFEMHKRGRKDDEDEPAPTQVERHELVDMLRPAFERRDPERGGQAAAEFVEAMRVRGGLLAERRIGVYSFSHLSFQEFLAAYHLVEEIPAQERLDFIQNNLTQSWWREVLLLAAGYLNVGSMRRSMAFVERLADLGQTAEARCRALELAGVALLEMQEGRVEQATCQKVVDDLVALLTDPGISGIPPSLRADAGRALARLRSPEQRSGVGGDPRPGVGVIVGSRHAVTLPDIVWHQVPAGPFLLGANDDEEGAWDDERPQHELDLPAFYIARYPVTNAQFAPFMQAGGYDDPQWWTEAGWAWRRKKGRQEPRYWHEERFNQANQPVVGVSWYEAMAYCA